MPAVSQTDVGGSNPGWLPFGGGGAAAVFTRPGFEPGKTSVSCITIRPLLGLKHLISPLLGAAFATDKKPKLCAKKFAPAALPFDRQLVHSDGLPHCLEPDQKLLTPHPTPTPPPPPSKK